MSLHCGSRWTHRWQAQALAGQVSDPPRSAASLSELKAGRHLFENSILGSQSLQRFRRCVFKSPFAKGGYESLMISYGCVNFGLLKLEVLTSQKGVFKQALKEQGYAEHARLAAADRKQEKKMPKFM